MKKEIRQNIQFKTSAEVLYSMLLDSKLHTAFTGAEAKISNKIGKKYTAYDGYIEGEILELIPGKKIVQSWKAEEEGWPDEVYSTIEFIFIENKNGTELQFTHKNIPAAVTSDFAKGWEEHYWDKMKAFLNER